MSVCVWRGKEFFGVNEDNLRIMLFIASGRNVSHWNSVIVLAAYTRVSHSAAMPESVRNLHAEYNKDKS